jgi:hypothetical protein
LLRLPPAMFLARRRSRNHKSRMFTTVAGAVDGTARATVTASTAVRDTDTVDAIVRAKSARIAGVGAGQVFVAVCGVAAVKA